jgi:secondary thiamine-phosphate synthase enzyme
MLRQAQTRLDVSTRGAGLTDITGVVRDWVAAQDIASGLLTVFVRHTSASLLIQENADPTVRADLEAFFRRIVPEQPGLYRHDDEGPDDMPAHIRAALTATTLSIPVAEGRPSLGTWQAIYLYEHRARPHRREVVLHLVGEDAR